MSISTGELDLEFFKQSGFQKKSCISCGHYFWTLDRNRKTCGDPPCDSYTFIGNSPVNRQYTLKEVRSLFLDFFKDNHKIIGPYPVVPRWRDDVLLVNASIYNFQPHVTSGRVSPPGNPLAMSQPSVRMLDTDLVGETGRHLTSFEMMCHDSFNYKDKFVYWKEETTQYCHKFLTEAMGIDPALISYKEKPWSGGGNGGNAFEVMIAGLEVATLVFMDMATDPEGTVEIDGNRYSKMDMMIVDTGYGLERLAWLSNGTATVYQAVLPYAIDHIVKNSSIRQWEPESLALLSRHSAEIEPFDRDTVLDRSFPDLKQKGLVNSREDLERQFDLAKAVYTIADHTKTLMILFSDYVIPSNVKVGYLARLLIRRALRSKAECGYTGSLFDLIRLHHEHLNDVIHNFPESFILEALSEEERKYSELEQKGESLILRTFDRKGTLSTDDLVTLYDSSGIIPEAAARLVLEKRNARIAIPGDFNSLITSLHEKPEAARKKDKNYPDIFTRPLYYDDTSIKEFNALVLYSGDKEIIPNQTAFYPDGGGQPTDLGYFTYKGKRVEMLGATRSGRSIVHKVENEIPEHSRIIGHLDYFRRHRLMVHHSSTHLLLGVLREILGEHVWQSGVQKGVDRSRIDVTHFRKPSDSELRQIEKKCLEYITQGRAIAVRSMEWNKAITKYGFRLFEGGVPDGNTIRVVEIDGVDAEGCGGTHLRNTSEIGFLKILKVETVQEGIQRFTFAAGEAALDYVQEIYSNEQFIEGELTTAPEKVVGSVSKLVQENLELKKEKDRHLKETVEAAIANAQPLDILGKESIFIEGSFGEDEMKGIISALFSLKKELSFVLTKNGKLTELRIVASKEDAISIGEKLAASTGASVQGNKRHAQMSGQFSIDKSLIRAILDQR